MLIAASPPPGIARYAPVVVHDRRDDAPLGSVADGTVPVPGVRRGGGRPTEDALTGAAIVAALAVALLGVRRRRSRGRATIGPRC